jgi:hypothetical protein
MRGAPGIVPVVEYFLEQLFVNNSNGRDFWKHGVLTDKMIPVTDSMNEDVTSTRLKVYWDAIVVLEPTQALEHFSDAALPDGPQMADNAAGLPKYFIMPARHTAIS